MRAARSCRSRSVRAEIDARFADYSENGQRTLGLARKKVGALASIGKGDENGMCFIGFVLFSDPLKPGIAATIDELRGLGVALKVITGDNVRVATSVARQIGFADAHVLSGREMRDMSDGALLNRVGRVSVFAEVEPNQKERIIQALRKGGNVVGYMGDGINDASALHAADVGLSVDDAVDVAKEVADIVLLEKDLGVLVRWNPRRPDHLRQHPEVRAHRHQRELRQHVQHGRGVAPVAVPAAAAEADPPDQHADRPARR